MMVARFRVIQDKKITRIGGTRSSVIDVCIICATNKNLLSEITKDNFRKDICPQKKRVSGNPTSIQEINNNVSQVFRDQGISRNSLYRKFEKLRIMS